MLELVPRGRDGNHGDRRKKWAALSLSRRLFSAALRGRSVKLVVTSATVHIDISKHGCLPEVGPPAENRDPQCPDQGSQATRTRRVKADQPAAPAVGEGPRPLNSGSPSQVSACDHDRRRPAAVGPRTGGGRPVGSVRKAVGGASGLLAFRHKVMAEGGTENSVLEERVHWPRRIHRGILRPPVENRDPQCPDQGSPAPPPDESGTPGSRSTR
jgi:hypothetical protein